MNPPSRFHYGPFRARLDVPPGIPHDIPECRHADRGAPPDGRVLRLHAPEDAWPPNVPGAPIQRSGWRALLSTTGADVQVAADAPADYPFFNELFATLGIAWTVLEGGMVLHASAIAVEGRAWLFSGPSGAGKSTLSKRLGPGARIADDQVLLLPDAGGWTCRAAFLEDVPAAPPERLFLVHQAAETKVRLLAREEALARLLRNLVLWPADRFFHERVLEASLRLLKTMRCYHLDAALHDISTARLATATR